MDEEALARIAALETGLADTNRILVHHQGTIVQTSEQHAGLIRQLNTEFDSMRTAVGTLQRDLSEHRRAVEALSSGSAGPAGLRLVDTRIIDKPGKFSGKSGDWKDWSESFQSFCAAAEEELGESMKAVARLEKTLLTADMTPTQRRHSRQLWSMVVQLLGGKARELRRNVCETGSGLEVWRALHQEYEPQVKNRHAGMLGQILNYKFKGTNFEEFRGSRRGFVNTKPRPSTTPWPTTCASPRS